MFLSSWVLANRWLSSVKVQMLVYTSMPTGSIRKLGFCVSLMYTIIYVNEGSVFAQKSGIKHPL